MAIQTTLGKAFEFACLQALYNHLSINQTVVIEQTNALNNARDFYNNIDETIQSKMIEGANAAIRIIFKLEPQLEYPLTNIPLYLAIQEDSRGVAGDVRDVVCIRRQNNWEIGFSCKHNHAAVKHSRLSPHIDFGESWLGIPCSINYFNEINPIFDELNELKDRGVFWRDISNKEQRFYIPLLQSFMNELRRLDRVNPEIIPGRLLSYLLGKNDFYKVITHDSRRVTQVQSFNIHGSLNRSSATARSLVNIPRLSMPTSFYSINFKPGSGNTLLVACDYGWTISMRIHSARSLVEPSLKFDVKLTGIPSSLHTQFEPW